MNRYKPLFSEYDDKEDMMHKVFRFKNNYGLALTMRNYNLMDAEWLWEACFIKFTGTGDRQYVICHDEHILPDLVAENLEEDEIEGLLEEVEELPRYDYTKGRALQIN